MNNHVLYNGATKTHISSNPNKKPPFNRNSCEPGGFLLGNFFLKKCI